MWYFNCQDCKRKGHGKPSWDIFAVAETHGYRNHHRVKVWRRGAKQTAISVGHRTV